MKDCKQLNNQIIPNHSRCCTKLQLKIHQRYIREDYENEIKEEHITQG
jgi:hypothetical protein